MKRGNETSSHLAMKSHVANILQRRGWLIRFEVKNADVVGFKPGTGGIWAIECERSPKWVLRNITKDLSRGAYQVVIVASTIMVAVEAQHQIEQQNVTIQRHVSVVTVDEFTEEFVKKVMEEGK